MNEVHASGRIIKAWSYGHDVFVRLSLSRDMGRPAKGTRHNRYDYFTVRFPGGRDAGLTMERGRTLEVHGFLQSRDYDEPLSSWLGDARPQGDVQLPEVLVDQATAIIAPRVATEIVAERWAVHGNGNGRR